MKKNPLFIERTNSNAGKIKRAKRNLGFLVAICLLITTVFAVSFAGQSNESKIKGAASYSLIVAFAAGVKGTKAANGHDETDEEFAARKGKAETEEAFAKRQVLAEISNAVKLATEEYKQELKELKEKLEKLTPADTEGIEAIKGELRKHGLAIEGLKDIKIGLERTIKAGSIADTLAKNKAKIDAFLKAGTGKLDIEVKTAQTQTSTDIGSRDDVYFQMHEGGRIGQIPVRKPFLRSLFKNQNATAEFIKYMDQATVTRDAQNVALCSTSNTNTKVTFAPQSIQITKIRDYIDICKDMMDDYAFVEGEIRNLIDTSVNLKIDDDLLTGNGTHPQTNSLDSVSSTWSATIAGITDYANSVITPNVVDVLAIAGAQIRELGKNNAWMPNAILINPGDLQKIKHLKNTLGDNLKFYPGFFVDAGGNCYIDGMLLVDNVNIPNDVAYIGDFTKGTVYARPGIGIEMSYENATNFETETVTVKAYERLNLLIRNVDANAFMKIDSLAAAVTAIELVPAP